jgi:Immunity protein 26
MNLAVLNKSRRAPQEGDIFVVKPPDGLFLFGRVIDTNARPFTVDFRGVLIYVYQVRSSVKTPAPALLREHLLIPPKMTNRLPWSRGYFEHTENRPLSAMDVLPQHCFKDTLGGYRDQAGNAVPGPVEPVGLFALSSYRTIDDAISEALGIPLAPD